MRENSFALIVWIEEKLDISFHFLLANKYNSNNFIIIKIKYEFWIFRNSKWTNLKINI